jgi:cytochrome c oxidase subunit IV
MPPPSEHRRDVLFSPLKIWAGLLLLGAISLAYALLGGLPYKPVFGLAIVAAQASLVLAGFMRLGKASGPVRMTALAGIVWLSFLFLMTFADLWTR